MRILRKSGSVSLGEAGEQDILDCCSSLTPRGKCVESGALRCNRRSYGGMRLCQLSGFGIFPESLREFWAVEGIHRFGDVKVQEVPSHLAVFLESLDGFRVLEWNMFLGNGFGAEKRFIPMYWRPHSRCFPRKLSWIITWAGGLIKAPLNPLI